ncbi:cytochrome c3 family protein [Anaeromyxobacter sp. Red801]|uniref:cytochrome c3 family protein n=1 Tax=Anaeromyxobacter sp. Red801 TaxID=3411632 RepID=UPI003BA0A71A
MPSSHRGTDWLRHPVSLAGAGLATVSGVLVVVLFAASLLGLEGGPYLGILAYLLLPGLLVLGLLLVPVGAALERRRLVRLAARGAPEPPLPVMDLNQPRTRRRLLVFLGLTTVNLLVLGIASYKGLEVMDSPAFCGSCHSVMDPEASAHRRSAHARVACVECHIGPGASWFVKSKLSGAWQVVSVALDLYPRPIPTPVQNLRPARDTCEQCHWPTKLVGDRLKVITRHAGDAASTPLRTVLVVHVGGAQGLGARTRGIHWHVDPGVRIRYLADEKRDAIGTVELTGPDGARATFRSKASAGEAGWREMDCVDCHNRPTHVYRSPEDEVDAALAAGRIDAAALPFARREALKALRAEYPSHEAARAGIAAALGAFYAGPEGGGAPREAVERAAQELGDAWARNVWPSMRIGWGTYPSLLGHEAAPGCFRCHDGDHETEDGRAIRADCDLCHELLAQEEKDPPILKLLAP